MGAIFTDPESPGPAKDLASLLKVDVFARRSPGWPV